MSTPLAAGTMLGLSVAIPFGPVSLLCVQRGISGGCGSGIATGLGAASAHGIFASLAIGAASAIAAHLTRWSDPIRLASAVLLIALGLRMLLRRRTVTARRTPLGVRGTYVSGLVLALSNPMTVLPYIAVTTSAAVTEAVDVPLTWWSIPGVIMGASVWYAALSSAVAWISGGLSATFIHHLNVIAATVLIGFGVVVALS